MERRRYGRAIVKRRVILADLYRYTPLMEGYAHDISPGGVCVSCAFELPIGLALEVEVFDTQDVIDAPALLVRGMVTWSMPDPSMNNMFLSGIRITMRISGRNILQPIRNYEAAQGAIMNIRAAVFSSTIGIPISLHCEPVNNETTQEPSLSEKLFKNKKIFLWLLLLLVFLFQLYGKSSSVIPAENTTTGSYWRSIRDNATTEQAANYTSTRVGPIQKSELSNEFHLRPVTAMEILSRGNNALEEAQPDKALTQFRDVQLTNSASTTETYLGKLGEIRALYALGEVHSALIALDVLQSTTGRMTHDVWQDMTREVRENITSNANNDLMPALSEILPLIPIASYDDYISEKQDDPEKRIEINTSDYVLHLIESDTVVATYPVGIGIDDSTPQGMFEIVNMIVAPDWYDRREGRVIPQGDPENPLGDHWIGLGYGTTTTPYGIHPTIEPESIGSDMSRGCIRMRPEDAAKVFAWCEIGAPVLIK